MRPKTRSRRPPPRGTFLRDNNAPNGRCPSGAGIFFCVLADFAYAQFCHSKKLREEIKNGLLPHTKSAWACLGIFNPMRGAPAGSCCRSSAQHPRNLACAAVTPQMSFPHLLMLSSNHAAPAVGSDCSFFLIHRHHDHAIRIRNITILWRCRLPWAPGCAHRCCAAREACGRGHHQEMGERRLRSDGLPSCGAKGLPVAVPTHGGATLSGVVSAAAPRRVTAPPRPRGHMLTGTDGAGNPLRLVAGPPRTPLGVTATMETGWCRHTGGRGWEVVRRASTTCPSEHPPGARGSTPCSGLRTVVDERSSGVSR